MASGTRPKTMLDALPREFRDKIYRLVLVGKAPIDNSDAILAAKRHSISKWRALREGKAPPPPPNDTVNGQYPRLQPALLATCRQIFCETYPIYYAENTFAVELATQIDPFLQNLHPAVMKVINPIRVLAPPMRSLPQLHFFFETLTADVEFAAYARRFSALPVEVEGEGTVYVPEREMRDFEEVQVTKMIDGGNGSYLGKAYVVRRKP
ncbi:hypothetical protein DOTSEDRAFT_56107 [Dothistroma septosporum NZE10]|uniref:DUF7730 domain-containing protein n=1 Tax=Dothistroma septosporum (strain NZE10 / CBS 128990) TaxID=675120 RepID=N1PG23_DOTSN|nr:hypothetical protein DOTSEDRAFT_56107 [Dothistroma septosporum NZE10]